MARKAIQITNGNVFRLETEFDLEERELQTNIGYWMVVQFGSTAIEGFLSEATFRETFEINEKLENGWVDVILKLVPKITWV